MNKALLLGFALCVAFVTALPKVESSEEDSCTRADGRPGSCMYLRECTRIYDIIRQRKRSQDDRDYIANSRCPIHKKGFVCCEEEISPGVQILIDQNCGRFGSTALTIGGKEIPIMSRPWMALLKFKTKDKGERFLCSGTLITNRFILTVAHTLMNPESELVSVRLGEHDVSSETDCAFNSRQQRICAPPVEDFGIERFFIHEQFSRETGQNDIALIKLSRVVEERIHIQPICLPVNRKLQRRADELTNFRIVGWGKTEYSESSDVPSEVFIARKNRSECATLFRREIKASQLCAGQTGRDSCLGDCGGPLIYLSSYQGVERFVQFGLVSYGSVDCGKGVPAVYTNIASFIPWLADKISNY